MKQIPDSLPLPGQNWGMRDDLLNFNVNQPGLFSNQNQNKDMNNFGTEGNNFNLNMNNFSEGKTGNKRKKQNTYLCIVILKKQKER